METKLENFAHTGVFGLLNLSTYVSIKTHAFDTFLLIVHTKTHHDERVYGSESI